MEKLIEALRNHIDFGVYPLTVLCLIIAILIYPAIMYLPVKWGYENGVLENIQMVFLFISLILAFRCKVNKKLFRFAGLVVTIIMLREINCGRTIFFPVPGTENLFYSWKDIKYGYLAHPLYGLYMAGVGLYFFWNKLYINLWHIIKSIKFPAWDMLFLFLGMFLGLYAEKASHNFVFEEMSELLFYVALTSIIMLYGYNKKFQVEE